MVSTLHNKTLNSNDIVSVALLRGKLLKCEVMHLREQTKKASTQQNHRSKNGVREQQKPEHQLGLISTESCTWLFRHVIIRLE